MLIAGYVYNVTSKRLELLRERKGQGYEVRAAAADARPDEAESTDRCQGAGIRGGVQEDVVSGVYKHLKHLQMKKKNNNTN